MLEAPVSFQRKRRAQVGARFGQADRLLQDREVKRERLAHESGVLE